MKNLPSLEIGKATWTEVQDFIKTMGGDLVAVWAWGATEQHGHRMLEETDVLIADYFVRVISENRPVLVFPTMPVGMSRHHENFAGTTSLNVEAATALVSSMLRSIYRSGARKLFAIMGHGGNVAPFHGAVTALGKEIAGLEICEKLDQLFYTKEGELGELIHSFGEKPSHAGALEASILYAILHHMGRDDEVERLRKVPIDDSMITPGSHAQGTQGGDPDSFQKMFPTGSKGDQRKAKIEVGMRILRLMSQSLLDQFDTFVKA